MERKTRLGKKQRGQIDPKWLFVIFFSILIGFSLLQLMSYSTPHSKMSLSWPEYISRVEEVCYSTHNPHRGDVYGCNVSWGTPYRECLIYNLPLNTTLDENIFFDNCDKLREKDKGILTSFRADLTLNWESIRSDEYGEYEHSEYNRGDILTKEFVSRIDGFFNHSGVNIIIEDEYDEWKGIKYQVTRVWRKVKHYEGDLPTKTFAEFEHWWMNELSEQERNDIPLVYDGYPKG